jgi:hypothetical protein
MKKIYSHLSLSLHFICYSFSSKIKLKLPSCITTENLINTMYDTQHTLPAEFPQYLNIAYFMPNLTHLPLITNIETANTHPPVMEDQIVGATRIIGLQRTTDCIKDFCEECSLKINVVNTKLVVFNKGGKLSRDEKTVVGGREDSGNKANKIPRCGIR